MLSFTHFAVFVHFAGCKEAMLSTKGSCVSLWGCGAGTGWWQGRVARGRGPMEKGTLLGFVVRYQLTL